MNIHLLYNNATTNGKELFHQAVDQTRVVGR